MKKSTALIVEIVKTVINCIMIPLYFINVFSSHAVIPGIDANGDRYFSSYYHYHSVFSKLSGEGFAYLVWGAVAITVLSIALSAFRFSFMENRALKITAHTVFCVSVAVFGVLFFIAGTIQYMY